MKQGAQNDMPQPSDAGAPEELIREVQFETAPDFAQKVSQGLAIHLGDLLRKFLSLRGGHGWSPVILLRVTALRSLSAYRLNC
jgi:hypothetical protein